MIDGLALGSPSPAVGRDVGAQATTGWGCVERARSGFVARLPHPDRCAILPPHEGEGEAIVLAARQWLGTPYRHQASVRGEGADCLGLVRGVWREVVGGEPEAVPAYSPDWAEVDGRETLLEGAGRWMRPRDPAETRAGDVVLFRMSQGAAVKHCAILSDTAGPEPRMIHAYWGRAVVESWMGPWWRHRLVAAFAFPHDDGR